MLPAWPGWDALHPFVVHFPVALLMFSPVFVVLAMLTRKRPNAFALSALLLLLAGTAAIGVAIETGEAAGELADHTPAINRAMTKHVDLAEHTRNAFVGLTLAYGLLLLLPRWVKAFTRPAVAVAAHAVFLVLLLAGCVLVLNTSHAGGRLVHDLGVHAMLPPETPAK